jgi:ligand-binding sensor domain-containing protein
MNATHARGWHLGRIVLLIILASILFSALAQAAPSLRFRKLGPLGNDEPSMLSLLQDRRGFMWIGTQSNGLYRYDGYRATRYRSKSGDARSLPHDRVAALYEDGQGRLWAGTQDGLARFNPESNDFTTFLPPKVSNNGRVIKAIVPDGKQGMWLATWGGLQHFTPATGNFVQYVHDPARPGSLAGNDLNALALDAQGGVWAGTWPGGLDYLAPGASAFEHRRVDKGKDPNARTNIVRALQFDRHGVLWIGTEAGVLRWDSSKPWDSRETVASPDSRVTSFYVDRDLWATTLSAGLLRWDSAAQRFDQYSHNSDDAHSLPGDNLRAMMQDRGGVLWIASFTDGIALANLSSSGFTRYLPYRLDGRHGRANNALLSLENGPDGTVWMGGNLGMGLFDPARGEVLRRYQAGDRPGSLSNNIVYSLYQEPKGPLWVGTANGLNRLDKLDGKFQVIRFGNTASNFINAIAPGRDGVLWLGTGNSLVRYDPLRQRSDLYFHDPKDPHSRSIDGTSVVLEDRQGRVWMGSEFNGGGLDMLVPASGKFRHLRADRRQCDSLARRCARPLVDRHRARRAAAGRKRGRRPAPALARRRHPAPQGARHPVRCQRQDLGQYAGRPVPLESQQWLGPAVHRGRRHDGRFHHQCVGARHPWPPVFRQRAWHDGRTAGASAQRLGAAASGDHRRQAVQPLAERRPLPRPGPPGRPADRADRPGAVFAGDGLHARICRPALH